MQKPVGGVVKKGLLAVIVILFLLEAYSAHVVSYPKYPEVKGCVNPFAVVKPVSRVQENWSGFTCPSSWRRAGTSGNWPNPGTLTTHT